MRIEAVVVFFVRMLQHSPPPRSRFLPVITHKVRHVHPVSRFVEETIRSRIMVKLFVARGHLQHPRVSLSFKKANLEQKTF